MKQPYKYCYHENSCYSSNGSHWEKLIRITKSLECDFSLCYVGTHDNQTSSVGKNKSYKISDFSRSDCYKFILVFFQAV